MKLFLLVGVIILIILLSIIDVKKPYFYEEYIDYD